MVARLQTSHENVELLKFAAVILKEGGIGKGDVELDGDRVDGVEVRRDDGRALIGFETGKGPAWEVCSDGTRRDEGEAIDDGLQVLATGRARLNDAQEVVASVHVTFAVSLVLLQRLHTCALACFAKHFDQTRAIDRLLRAAVLIKIGHMLPPFHLTNFASLLSRLLETFNSPCIELGRLRNLVTEVRQLLSCVEPAQIARLDRSQMLFSIRDPEVGHVEIDLVPDIFVQKLSTDKKILDLVVSDHRPRHGKAGHNRTHFEKIWMITDLPQLHETIDDAEVVSAREALSRLWLGT